MGNTTTADLAEIQTTLPKNVKLVALDRRLTRCVATVAVTAFGHTREATGYGLTQDSAIDDASTSAFRLCAMTAPKTTFAPFEAKMKAMKDELDSFQTRLVAMTGEIDAMPAERAPDAGYRQDIKKAQREAKRALARAAREIQASYDPLKMIQIRAEHISRGE